VPTFHDENRSGFQLERPHLQSATLERPRPDRGQASAQEIETQRKRMLIALAILLVTLGAVIVKDWDFWFPSRRESPEAVALRKAKALAESANAPAPVAHEQHKAAKAEESVVPLAATTERRALPPLQVEVVAGNRSVNVPAKEPAVIHVDVGSGATGASVTAPPGIAPGSSRGVRVSREAAQSVEVSVPPDYPLLARQMKVQGVVSLLALIARDGTIQQLQILSGPEILATAAREAVKQWHFKPYLQNGQPVETQAKITVNFTISTN